MEILRGVAASKGIAFGPGFIYRPSILVPRFKRISDVSEELKRLQIAVQQAKEELEVLKQKAVKSIGVEAAEIFQAQMMMLEDPDLLETTEQKIRSEYFNCDAAFYEAAEGYASVLQDLQDEYFRARAADIRDVSRRVIRILSNEEVQEAKLSTRSIILAEDLAPSDTVQFNRSFIAGFFTTCGGATSHTAILSRALEVPAVVGGGQLPDELTEDVLLILDGDNGLLIIDPDEITIEKYEKRRHEQIAKALQEKSAALKPALTSDNKRIDVAANIGNLEDAEVALTYGAEGVGLFRTEFSYLEQNTIPGEDDLVQFYRRVFRIFAEYPVIVRTLDIGGDKEIPHLKLPVEANPFLGVRGIRLCFARTDLFKPQLRAILRAGIDANLCIMFPMIATVGEVRKARAILNECMEELNSEDLPYNKHPQVGIMIEVPSAAICADQLAKEVDFFSIGTNDLTQYTLAVDRTNANLSDLVSALQPAVLRLIKGVIESAHTAGIWVGMCGEMAGEPLAIPILLGFGLDEFSMNSPAIPQAKEIIRKWNITDARALSEQALQCETPQEVEKLVKGWVPSTFTPITPQ